MSIVLDRPAEATHSFTTAPAAVLEPGALYIAGDRVVCADPACAGVHALWTGHTVDGVPLIEVTAEDRALWAEAGLGEMRCDHRLLG